MPIIELHNVSKEYTVGNSPFLALSGVSFSVEKGELVSVVGSSGSGKSTLLNLMGGLDVPTEGDILINGSSLGNMKNDELTVFRRENIGFIFQSYNLVPTLNVHDNIILPLAMDDQVINEDEIAGIAEKLQIESKLLQSTETLSGGQKQRVAIARAICAKPSIILADEPTGNLDSGNSQNVMDLFMQSVRAYHQTAIIVTHSYKLANMTDRRVKIVDGKIDSDSSHLLPENTD